MMSNPARTNESYGWQNYRNKIVMDFVDYISLNQIITSNEHYRLMAIEFTKDENLNVYVKHEMMLDYFIRNSRVMICKLRHSIVTGDRKKMSDILSSLQKEITRMGCGSDTDDFWIHDARGLYRYNYESKILKFLDFVEQIILGCPFEQFEEGLNKHCNPPPSELDIRYLKLSPTEMANIASDTTGLKLMELLPKHKDAPSNARNASMIRGALFRILSY